MSSFKLKLSDDEKRDFLRARGWVRCDRAIGTNKSIELWALRENVGAASGRISLGSAFKSAMKQPKEPSAG